MQEVSAQISELEFEILSYTGFDVDIDLPNQHISDFCRHAQVEPQLEKYAYQFMNDCFRTVCPIFFHPKIIAATCIWMASRYMQ